MKNKNKLTITIGISAYNEEANIGHLIKDLLVQKQINFTLNKIIIISDGSSDQTLKEAKKIPCKYLKIIQGQTREGLASRLNQITKITSANILVLLNADILIKNELFLEKIIEPIIREKADLTSVKIRELQPVGFTEKTLFYSMKVKNNIFEQFNQGNNLYTCHGQARAFSKKLYKKIQFKNSVGEDAYSYLYCIFNGFTYKYIKDTTAYYKLPGTFSDHQRQSIRYFQSKNKFIEDFGEEFIRINYRLPIRTILTAIVYSLFRWPFYTLAYGFIFIYLKIRSKLNGKVEDKWQIAQTSKILRRTYG